MKPRPLHRAGMKRKDRLSLARELGRSRKAGVPSVSSAKGYIHREPHSFGYVDSFERPIARRGRGARSDRWRPS